MSQQHQSTPPQVTGPAGNYPPINTTIAPLGRLSFFRAFRSEILKLTTTRGTWISAGIVLACTALIMQLAYSSTAEFSDALPPEAIISFFFFPSVLTLSIAVSHMTNEYAHTTIRVSLQSVPKRQMFYAAKLLSIIAYSAIITALFLMIGFGVAAINFSDTSYLYDDLRPYLYLSLVIIFTALAGCAMGTIIRHTAASLTVIFGALFLIQLLAVLPGDFIQKIIPYLPFNLAMNAMVSDDAAVFLGGPSPDMSMLIYAGYCIAVIIGGAVAMQRRDA